MDLKGALPTTRREDGRRIRTGNVLDYVHWRGDLALSVDPWHNIDSLIAALIAYANFGENELVFDSGREISLRELPEADLLSRYPQRGAVKSIQDQVTELLGDMAQTRRFGDIRILDQVNDEDSSRDIQFSAVTLQVPDVGTVIAYRGTDPSVVGWKEDFMMSYMSPVPAQAAASAYLEKVARRTSGPLLLCGHSKGGNLALYAAAHADRTIQGRLKAVCSFDGPGLDDDTMESEGYRRIVSGICSIVPSDSIIGRLMNYHPNYRVVTSTKVFIYQHDPFTWNLVGCLFDEVEEISSNAQVMDKTLHEWIKSCTPRQRELFTETVFGFFDRKGKACGADVSERTAGEDGMDENTRQMVISLLYRLVGTHVGNLYDARIRKPLIQAAAKLKQDRLADKAMAVKSIPVEIDNTGNGYREAMQQTALMAEFNVLSQTQTLRLQLLAEEMIGMVRTLTGEVKSTFWIECVKNKYDLRVSTETVMDRHKRRALIAASTGPTGEASRSFIGRLRDVFQQAMASETDRVAFELGEPGGSERKQWDRYEHSVLLRLADNVRIDIRGRTVTLMVSKVFKPVNAGA